MRELFRGWRRKAGISDHFWLNVGYTLLVVACAIQLAWIRGRFVRDEIRYDIDDASFICFRLNDCLIEFEYNWDHCVELSTALRPTTQKLNWSIYPTEVTAAVETLTGLEFRAPVVNDSGWASPGLARLQIPSLPTVLMLSLLSAYLIVTGSRKN